MSQYFDVCQCCYLKPPSARTEMYCNECRDLILAELLAVSKFKLLQGGVQ